MTSAEIEKLLEQNKRLRAELQATRIEVAAAFGVVLEEDDPARGAPQTACGEPFGVAQGFAVSAQPNGKRGRRAVRSL